MSKQAIDAKRDTIFLVEPVKPPPGYMFCDAPWAPDSNKTAVIWNGESYFTGTGLAVLLAFKNMPERWIRPANADDVKTLQDRISKLEAALKDAITVIAITPLSSTSELAQNTIARAHKLFSNT